MENATTYPDLPPLPSYTLKPRPDVLPPISDKVLILLLPIAAYWIFSLFFHYLDVNDIFPQYRLHTPAEILKRNRVSRSEVVRDVIIQQLIQTIVGLLGSMTEPEDTYGSEEHDVAVWAQRIRMAQRAIPGMLSVFGVNSIAIAHRLSSYPQLAGLFSGGRYQLFQSGALIVTKHETIVSAFANWEVNAARALYWLIIPALQFILAAVIIDSWQYFWHRAMHMNQWLYRTFHSRHHRLYVPYAFGALYNHPFEGFLLDTLGAAVGYKVACLSTRQGMWFFTCSIIKTVDDHCGYSLPWDPLQRLTSNNAGYHDIHHQSWGIKTNFSQPYFTFWDWFLGTEWAGGDVSARYERSRKGAQQQPSYNEKKVSSNDSLELQGDIQSLKLAMDGDVPSHRIQEAAKPRIPPGPATSQAAESREQVLQDRENGGLGVLIEETREEKEAEKLSRPAPRRRAITLPTPSGSFKSLKDKVHGSLHGRGGTVIGLESSH